MRVCHWRVRLDRLRPCSRAVELGSQAERLGLDSVWFAQLARIAERRQEAERHEAERGE
jgi:hypothetical protein